MEKKIVTLAELKGVKVYLRNSIERNTGDLSTVRKYLAVNRKVKELESMLLWSILSLILILALSGCNTIEGARMDVHQWTETPAHHK